MKKYLLKSKASHIMGEGLKTIQDMIDNVVSPLQYPINAIDTGEVGDLGLPIVKLENGKTVNLFYFDYEEL